MAQYKASDFVEQKDPFEIIKESLTQVVKLETKLIQQNKALQESFSQISKGNTGGSAKELVEITEKLTKANKDLETVQKSKIALEKNELKLLQDLETLKQKEIKTSKDAHDLKVKENKEAERKLNLDKKQQKETEKTIGLQNQLLEKNKQLRAERSKIGDINRDLTKAELSQLKSINKQIDSNNKKLESMSDTLAKQKTGIGRYSQGVVNAFGKMTAAIGGAYLAVNLLKDAFDIMVRFNKQLSYLESVSSGTKEEMKGLSDQAKKLGAETQFSAFQILELDTELAKLGFTAKEIKDAVPGVQALAAATGTDLAMAAELAGATMKIFALNANESGRVADVLAVSTAKSALSMSKLATALPIVGTSARIAGESMENTIAKLGILSDRGMDASMSATAMRDIYSDLARQGLTWEQAQNAILSSTNKTKTAFDLFGKTGMNTAIILAENAVSVGKLDKALIDLDMTANDMAKVMLDNVAGDITIAKSAWEGFVLSIEDGKGGISTSIRGVIQLFTELITVLTDTNKASGILTEKLGKGGIFSFQMDPGNYEKLANFALNLDKVKNSIESTADSDKGAKVANSIFALNESIASLNTELNATNFTEIYEKQFIKDKIKLVEIYKNEILKAEKERTKAAEQAAKDALINAEIEKAQIANAEKLEAKRLADEKNKEESEKLAKKNKEEKLKQAQIEADILRTSDLESYNAFEAEQLEIQKEYSETAKQDAADEAKYKADLANWEADEAIKALDRKKEAEKEKIEQIKAIYQNFTESVANDFAELAKDNELTLKNSLKVIAKALIKEVELYINAILFRLAGEAIKEGVLGNIPKLLAIGGGIIGVKALSNVAINALEKEQNFADGTPYVTGPGTSRSDSIPANLSVGEAVIPAHANRLSPKLVHGLVEGKLTDSNAATFVNNQFSDNRIVSKLEENNAILGKLGFAYSLNNITYIQRADGSLEKITT